MSDCASWIFQIRETNYRKSNYCMTSRKMEIPGLIFRGTIPRFTGEPSASSPDGAAGSRKKGREIRERLCEPDPGLPVDLWQSVFECR